MSSIGSLIDHSANAVTVLTAVCIVGWRLGRRLKAILHQLRQLGELREIVEELASDVGVIATYLRMPMPRRRAR